MAIFNSRAILPVYGFKFEIINAILLAIASLAVSSTSATAEVNYVAQSNQTIEGISGGLVDSQGCGFIAGNPNHKMNLSKRIDYMRLTVQANGGQPTLLVLGPNFEDSFCVLGDEISGLQPEISGVWEAGDYEVYVGDRSGEQHRFVLDISTDN